MGDYNGIGPEIVLKAVRSFSREESAIIIIGSGRVFEDINQRLDQPIALQTIEQLRREDIQPGNVYMLDIFNNEKIPIRFGAISKHAGQCAGKCIEEAVKFAMGGAIDCIVTAPLSKEALILAGYHFPGQTELLAFLTHSNKFLMMLLVDDFRVTLVTTHCAISEISGQLSHERIFEKIQILDKCLRTDFEIESPSIAVTALNPHASDGGAFGKEEQKYIAPAIESARQAGINAHGPFPADTLFAAIGRDRFDGYLAMYHDQGLIPLKMKAGGRGVNFTAGLPIIRTSPDHGTAFDIAGKMMAQSGSMLEAIKLGQHLAQKRNTG